MKLGVLLLFIALLITACTPTESYEANTNIEINDEKVYRELDNKKTESSDKNKEWIPGKCKGWYECGDYCKTNDCATYCSTKQDNEFCAKEYAFLFEYEYVPRIERNDLLKDRDCSDFHFTKYLVDPNKVRRVTPIGSVHGSGAIIVGRSYVAIKDELTEKIPIYAPTKMVLTQGSYYGPAKLPEGHLYDYALEFETGCGFTIGLAHVKEVISDIGKQLPEVSDYSGTTQLTPVVFEAGDLIGYFIPNKGGAGFDFIVDDLNIVNQFPNQKRYQIGYGSNLLNRVCPYDLYRGEMKVAYYDRLGGGGGTLFENKDCGMVSRDVLGTISGQWFLDVNGSVHDIYKEGEYGSPISIVGDEERINIGHLGSKEVNWIYPDNPTHRLPVNVTDEHCYQFYPEFGEADGYAYFKIVSDTEIQVFYSETGTCPDKFPENGWRTYYK